MFIRIFLSSPQTVHHPNVIQLANDKQAMVCIWHGCYMAVKMIHSAFQLDFIVLAPVLQCNLQDVDIFVSGAVDYFIQKSVQRVIGPE